MLSEIQTYLSERTWDGLTLKAKTVRLVLDMGLPLCGLTVQDIYDLNDKVYIHPHCSAAIIDIVEKYKMPLEDSKLFQTLKMKDYHDCNDIKEFASLLDKQLADCDEKAEVRKQLNKIFAVDGFGSSSSYVNYIDHLKFKIREEPFSFDPPPFSNLLFPHVLAVRTMCSSGSTPLQIHEAILTVLQNEEGTPLSGLAKLYRDLLGTRKDEILQKVVKTKMVNELLSITKESESN